ncbi:MAG TPA: hypothetical protein VD772_10020, partial [Anseongella sp.]|nr:hypothetical protein [Anseongella sp.]
IKDGKVAAMPKWDYATSENILNTINGQPVNMVMNIQDRALDPARPMFVAGNGESRPYYKTKYSKIVRYLPGYREENLQYIQKEDTTILYANNLSIRELFYQAYKDKIFPCLSSTDIGNMKEGTRWEISDPLSTRFFDPPKESMIGNRIQDSLHQEWLERNLYGYELRHPGKLSKAEAYDLMRKDLNKLFGLYFNITASIKDGPRHKYLVLRLLGSREQAENLLTAAGDRSGAYHDESNYQSYNAHFEQHFLIRLTSAKLLPDLTLSRVVNETGIAPDFRIDFVFPRTMDGNFELTQRELAKYGLYLAVEDRNVPILVIREKGARQ